MINPALGVDTALDRNLRDRVTGFTGRATAYAVYLTGCHQVCLTPPVDRDGKLQEAQWFDIERLECVDSAPAGVQPSPGGGPRHGGEAPPAR